MFSRRTSSVLFKQPLKFNSRGLLSSSSLSSSSPLTRTLIYNPTRTFSTGGNKPDGDENVDTEGLREQSDQFRRQFEDMQDEARPDYEDKNSTPKVLLVCSATLIAAFLVLNVITFPDEKKKKKKNVADKKTVYKGVANIGGDWVLKGVDGQPVTNEDFRGKYTIYYFGFTMCPDICPVSLGKLAKALNVIDTQAKKKDYEVAPIFVSVDPDRDTGEGIRDYLKMFSDKIVGVTGEANDDPTFREMLKKYKIYAVKIPTTLNAKSAEKLLESENKPTDKNDYSMDHATFMYLMDRDGKFLGHLGSNLSEDELAKTVNDHIAEDLQNELEEQIQAATKKANL